MSKLKTCRICLQTETRMYRFDRFQLKYYYEEIMAMNVDDNDDLPHYFCHECATLLHKFHKFKEKCFNAQKVLKDLLWEGPITGKTIYHIDRQKLNLKSSIDFITLSNRVKTYNVVFNEQKPLMQNVGNTSPVPFDEPLIDMYIDPKPDSPGSIVSGSPNYEPEIDMIINSVGDENPTLLDTTEVDANASTMVHSPTTIFIGEQDMNNIQKPSESVKSTEEKIIAIKPKLKKHKYAKKKVNILNLTHWKKFNLTEDEAMKEFRARAETPKYLAARYKCTDCFKGFSKKDMLARHTLLRHNESQGASECRFCRMRFKWECLVRKHMRQHYTKYQCLRCNLVCSLENTAFLHEQCHNGIKRKCKYCNEEFKHLSTYYTHLRTHRSDYVCTLCGVSFVSKAGLHQHKKVKHVNNEIESPDDDDDVNSHCTKCNITFETPRAYVEHLFHSAMHAEGVETDSDYEQTMPRKVTAKKEQSKICSELKRSLASTEQPKFTVKQTKKRRRLRRKPMDCHQCGKHFDTQTACMKHHLEAHPRTSFFSSTERHICEICGASLAPGSVAMHQNIHSRKKVFSCDTCGRTFHSSVGLKRHLVEQKKEERRTSHNNRGSSGRIQNGRIVQREHFRNSVETSARTQCNTPTSRREHTLSNAAMINAHENRIYNQCTADLEKLYQLKEDLIELDEFNEDMIKLYQIANNLTILDEIDRCLFKCNKFDNNVVRLDEIVNELDSLQVSLNRLRELLKNIKKIKEPKKYKQSEETFIKREESWTKNNENEEDLITPEDLGIIVNKPEEDNELIELNKKLECQLDTVEDLSVSLSGPYVIDEKLDEDHDDKIIKSEKCAPYLLRHKDQESKKEDIKDIEENKFDDDMITIVFKGEEVDTTIDGECNLMTLAEVAANIDVREKKLIIPQVKGRKKKEKSIAEVAVKRIRRTKKSTKSQNYNEKTTEKSLANIDAKIDSQCKKLTTPKHQDEKTADTSLTEVVTNIDAHDKKSTNQGQSVKTIDNKMAKVSCDIDPKLKKPQDRAGKTIKIALADAEAKIDSHDRTLKRPPGRSENTIERSFAKVAAKIDARNKKLTTLQDYRENTIERLLSDVSAKVDSRNKKSKKRQRRGKKKKEKKLAKVSSKINARDKKLTSQHRSQKSSENPRLLGNDEKEIEKSVAESTPQNDIVVEEITIPLDTTPENHGEKIIEESLAEPAPINDARDNNLIRVQRQTSEVRGENTMEIPLNEFAGKTNTLDNTLTKSYHGEEIIQKSLAETIPIKGHSEKSDELEIKFTTAEHSDEKAIIITYPTVKNSDEKIIQADGNEGLQTQENVEDGIDMDEINKIKEYQDAIKAFYNLGDYLINTDKKARKQKKTKKTHIKVKKVKKKKN